jgi:hypothetical protein
MAHAVRGGFYEYVAGVLPCELTKQLYVAAYESGYEGIVDLLHSRNGHQNVYDNFIAAIRSGNMALVMRTMLEVNSCADDALLVACRGGDPAIIDAILTKYPSASSNEGLMGACWGGHLEVVRSMISRGATDLNRAAQYACQSGNIEVVKFITSACNPEWNRLMFDACVSGSVEVVDLVAGNTGDLLRDLVGAVTGGNIDIVRRALFGRPAVWVTDGAVARACSMGRVDIAMLIMTVSEPTGWHVCLYEAAAAGCLPLVILMLDGYMTTVEATVSRARGAVITHARMCARTAGARHVVDYLRDKV